MVRTKADISVKAMGAKASRKSLPAPTRSSKKVSLPKATNTRGGNSPCHRETPEWQKPITTFFKGAPPSDAGQKAEEPNKDSSSS